MDSLWSLVKIDTSLIVFLHNSGKTEVCRVRLCGKRYEQIRSSSNLHELLWIMWEAGDGEFRQRIQTDRFSTQTFSPEFHITADNWLDIVLINTIAGRTHFTMIGSRLVRFSNPALILSRDLWIRNHWWQKKGMCATTLRTDYPADGKRDLAVRRNNGTSIACMEWETTWVFASTHQSMEREGKYDGIIENLIKSIAILDSYC